MFATSCLHSSRTVADAGERGPTLLESVLGATPQEFESPILRHPDLRRRAWITFARCATCHGVCLIFCLSYAPAICLIPDKPVWWHAEMTHVAPGQRRCGGYPNGTAHAAEACTLPLRGGRLNHLVVRQRQTGGYHRARADGAPADSLGGHRGLQLASGAQRCAVLTGAQPDRAAMSIGTNVNLRHAIRSGPSRWRPGQRRGRPWRRAALRAGGEWVHGPGTGRTVSLVMWPARSRLVSRMGLYCQVA